MPDASPDSDEGGATSEKASSDQRRVQAAVVSAVRARVDRGSVAALALAAVGAFVAVAVAIDVFPFRSLNHDEGVYLQQAELLLSGRLFLRPPVEDAFRPWFFVESERGLYAKYAPIPAAVFALGKLLGGYAVALGGIAAGVVAGTVALGRELFDVRVGVLAGVLLLATPLFVVHSGVYLPYALTTALNVAFAVWYLRGERRKRSRDATLAGVAIGLAFFARPFTAVLFALPFVAHAVVTLVRSGGWRVPFGWITDDEIGGDPDVETAVADARGLFERRFRTAALGAAGVLAAVAYNAVVTGDPFVFPYLAFAPQDGLGFGERAILGHEVEYTLALGLRANALVLADLFTEWVVAGSLGAAAAAVGTVLALVGRGPVSAGADSSGGTDESDGSDDRVRRGLLAATFLTVAAGNVAFWGNYNVLGAIDVDTDGLIHYLGPYYHYDLIVPTAVFGAVAVVAGADAARSSLGRLAARRDALTADRVRLVGLALVLVAAGVGGGVAVGAVQETVDRNTAVTTELRDGYGPLANDGAPDEAVVFLPTPYGPWLNHPFQTLRNDADYDGETVYALSDTRELAVADAYPERDLYRYVYAGSWSPTDDEPVRGTLREVARVYGDRVRLSATFVRPASVEGTTVRITGDEGSAYLVATDEGGPLALEIRIEDDRLLVFGDALVSSGDEQRGEPVTLALADRDEVHVEVFVSTGTGRGYSYRVVFPVEGAADGTVTALSPTVERCPVPTRCVPVGVGERPADRGADVTVTASE